MKIGELAQRTQTPASTIRYYERSGIMSEPKRQGGQRIYEMVAVDELTAIKTAQQLGFNLNEIGLLLQSFKQEEAPSEQCRSLAKMKLEELDALVSKVNKMKNILQHGLSCNCTSLNGCYVQARC